MSSSAASTRTLPTLHEFFAPGGILARSPLPYEYRPGQYEMAKAVEQALAEHRHLIVEAGTGTGKTLAYLLPALRTGQRVIVSTGTKTLQDQLFFRDVPFLETLLGDRCRVCYMKGRANYLCRHKLYALRDQPVLSGLDEIDEYRQIAEWEQASPKPATAPSSPACPNPAPLWHKLDARAEACLGSTCPEFARCFITAMRRQAARDPTSSSSTTISSSPIPPPSNWPPNSARRRRPSLEAACRHLRRGPRARRRRLQLLRPLGLQPHVRRPPRDTRRLLRGKKVVSTDLIQHSRSTPRARPHLLRRAARTRATAASLHQPRGVPRRVRRALPRRQERHPLKLSTPNWSAIASKLDEVHRPQIAPHRRLRAQLEFLLEIQRHQHGLSGSSAAAPPTGQLALHCTVQRPPHAVPRLPPGHAHRRLRDPARARSSTAFPSVVLTSATLTVPGRLRAHPPPPRPRPKHASSSSPRTSTTSRRPSSISRPTCPTRATPTSPKATERILERVLEITRGRAFCLFTSYAQMRALYERLLARSSLPHPAARHRPAQSRCSRAVPRHAQRRPLRHLAASGRESTSRAKQLSCVIIDRLPFAVPSDPVVQARMARHRGIRRPTLLRLPGPRRRLTLKQGFGRLIRSLEDRGVLVLLDPRVRTQRYGQIFLQSLPPYRITQTITDVESFFTSVP